MKTTMLISCALVGALAAACSHESKAPQSPDNATNPSSTVTTSYNQPAIQEPMATPMLDNSPDQQTGAIATTGDTFNGGSATATATTGSTASKIPADQQALNEPQANAKPVQPTTSSAPTRAKSATDQGQSKGEVKMTASIRKRMMASKTLSFGAKNIKVITQGTSVTLVGSVKSDAEKNEIEGLARNTDGVTNVDDQIVVKQ